MIREYDLRYIPDVLSAPTNFLINTEINSRIWPNSTDDDLRLLDNLLSTTTNVHNLSFSNSDNSQSLINLTKQQNNNSSQLINSTDEKQLIGPIGSNL